MSDFEPLTAKDCWHNVVSDPAWSQIGFDQNLHARRFQDTDREAMANSRLRHQATLAGMLAGASAVQYSGFSAYNRLHDHLQEVTDDLESSAFDRLRCEFAGVKRRLILAKEDDLDAELRSAQTAVAMDSGRLLVALTTKGGLENHIVAQVKGVVEQRERGKLLQPQLLIGGNSGRVGTVPTNYYRRPGLYVKTSNG